MKEKIEVQRQAEKEYDDLQKQVKILEIDLEEQVNRFIELEQEKNAELMDLRQQNQALEKQLEKTRKFLDVSMVKGVFHEGGWVSTCAEVWFGSKCLVVVFCFVFFFQQIPGN